MRRGRASGRSRGLSVVEAGGKALLGKPWASQTVAHGEMPCDVALAPGCAGALLVVEDAGFGAAVAVPVAYYGDVAGFA